jgi:tRNA A-37 threonylcarbamoyl transferase component Bud32
LRRFKARGDPETEAAVMALAREHGYPVPRVQEVLPNGLVLQRFQGPTMMADSRLRPWRIPRHARLLADLHDALHRVPSPDGGVLIHLDLHPKNVLLARRGPIVIDWANARGGDPALDCALTWVILMTSAGRAGRAFARPFARHIDVRTALPEAVAFRVADRNVTDAERTAARQLLARQPLQ